MELADIEIKFIKIYCEAKRNNNTDILICIYAVLDRFLEDHGSKPKASITKFTRGQYKRAIKLLRVAQAWALHIGESDMATEYDHLVRYIRKRCLQRMAAVA